MAPEPHRLPAGDLRRLVAGAAAVEAAPGLYAVRVSDAGTSRAILARAEASAWQAATINAERAVDAGVRAAEVVDERAAAALIEECRERIFAATRSLAALLAPGCVPAEIQIVRYFAGGHYADHRDSPAAEATPRRLSVVWYLNDDFSGGQTSFGEPEACVEPLAGAAIAFLPGRLHRAEPVLSGTKYAVTAWYHAIPGRVR